MTNTPQYRRSQVRRGVPSPPICRRSQGNIHAVAAAQKARIGTVRLIPCQLHNTWYTVLAANPCWQSRSNRVKAAVTKEFGCAPLEAAANLANVAQQMTKIAQPAEGLPRHQ